MWQEEKRDIEHTNWLQIVVLILFTAIFVIAITLAVTNLGSAVFHRGVDLCCK